jgi:hypothetical protein
VTTFDTALDELADDEGVYSLPLTGDQARATLRALGQAPAGDVNAAAARDRLARLLAAPPHDLPDADALLAFRVSRRSKCRRKA